MSADWKPGDYALCVDDSPSRSDEAPAVKVGRIYRVFGVGLDDSGDLGLFLDELESRGFGGGYLASRFRKIHPHTPDAEDAETIRFLNGLPVGEPA